MGSSPVQRTIQLLIENYMDTTLLRGLTFTDFIAKSNVYTNIVNAALNCGLMGHPVDKKDRYKLEMTTKLYVETVLKHNLNDHQMRTIDIYIFIDDHNSEDVKSYVEPAYNKRRNSVAKRELKTSIAYLFSMIDIGIRQAQYHSQQDLLGDLKKEFLEFCSKYAH